MEVPELVRREPAASLRGSVNAYYGYREQTARPLRRREGPGGDVVVILGFDTRWWIGDAVDRSDAGSHHSSFAGGLRETQVLTEHGGRSDGMQVNLTPAAAQALFRVPMSALAGRVVDLEELLGRRATRLVEQLQEQRCDDGLASPRRPKRRRLRCSKRSRPISCTRTAQRRSTS